MSAQDHFKSHPSDIVLCSTLKTGTTWLKALAFATITRSHHFLDDSTHPLLHKLPHECVPFVEFDMNQSFNTRAAFQALKPVDVMSRELPLLSTHMPYSSLPKPMLESGCKLVYIWRDPKDAFVSTYLFYKRMAMQKNLDPLPLEHVFESFCEGVSNYGPYWDHVLGYSKASLDFPGRILVLKYEEMKKDTCFYLKKLAEFMGYAFSPEEEEKGVVEKIVKMCTFENLSNLEVNKNGKHRDDTANPIQNNVFFRKGRVGDWENHLSPEMAARIDEIMEQKMGGLA